MAHNIGVGKSSITIQERRQIVPTRLRDDSGKEAEDTKWKLLVLGAVGGCWFIRLRNYFCAYLNYCACEMQPHQCNIFAEKPLNNTGLFRERPLVANSLETNNMLYCGL